MTSRSTALGQIGQGDNVIKQVMVVVGSLLGYISNIWSEIWITYGAVGDLDKDSRNVGSGRGRPGQSRKLLQ